MLHLLRFSCSLFDNVFVCLLACMFQVIVLSTQHTRRNEYVCMYIYIYIYILICIYIHTYAYVYIYTWWLIKILSCRNSHSSPGAGFTFTKLSGTPLSFAGAHGPPNGSAEGVEETGSSGYFSNSTSSESDTMPGKLEQLFFGLNFFWNVEYLNVFVYPF